MHSSKRSRGGEIITKYPIHLETSKIELKRTNEWIAHTDKIGWKAMKMQTLSNSSKCENNHRDTLIYHLYLDCANVDDISTIDDTQIETILAPILRKRKYPFPNTKFVSIIKEIQLEYQRVMCYSNWQRLIEIYPQLCEYSSQRSEYYRFILANGAIPTVGRVTTGMENFQVTKKKVHWDILYVLPEVYDAMCRVVESCQSMMNMSLFMTSHGKSVTLIQFEEQQIQTYTSTIKYLKNQWVERVVQSVRMCLRDIGKGCFDLDQKTPHIYSVIKLQRLMELKILVMQSALENLIETSTLQYVSMLISPSRHIPHFDDDFTWGSNLTMSQFPSSSSVIFKLELTMNEEGAYYTTNLPQYITTIIRLLDDAIVQCHQIRPAKVFLLPKLTFPPDLYLSAIGLMDERIIHAKNQLIDVYQRSVIPLQAYAKEYDKYLELFNLDIEDYIRTMREEEFDVARIRDEISSQLVAKDELFISVPADICIGPFRIIIERLRGFLIDKRKNLATHLLCLLTQQLQTHLAKHLTQYLDIETKLRKDPRDIEELCELREYMENIPLTVLDIDRSVQQIVLDYEVLDMFLWNIPDEDFKNKWLAIGYSSQIRLQLERTNEHLKEAFENFQKLQLVHQASLTDEIGLLGVHLTTISLQTDIKKVHECAIEAKRVWKLLKNCEEQALQLNKRQRLFGEPIISYEHLTKLVRDFEPYWNLWCTASEWLKTEEMWLGNPLINVDSEQMENTVNELNKSILRSVKIFHDQPKIRVVAEEIATKIESFKPYVTLVKSLRNPGIKMRHYENMSKQTKIERITTPNVTLNTLLENGIMDHIKIILEITEGAAKEYTIEASLDKMVKEWAATQMEIIEYKNTGTHIMKISDETLVMLDDHILNTQQIGFSPFRGAFENIISEWEGKLKLTRDVLNEWITVQKSWMYLEPIFSSEDISRQLPMESKKFNTVERNWRRIMKNASECPNILQICPDKSLLESLKECITLMDVVHKGLVDYLETKRMVFPRFYFLSDDELLEILARTKNVRAVQPYLNKCFENMRQLRFEDSLEITRMYSAENEEVYLRPPVYPVGNVENWLGQVENSMKNSLREIIGDALATIESTARDKWVYMWPGQVVICAGQTYWTYHIEDAIKNNALRKYWKVLLNHLEELRKLVRGQPTEIQRLMLEALITIQVHERDVVAQLMKNNIRTVNDFNWISQLRYYWIEDAELFIRVVNAQFPYGYEYLGNNGRLVITPLTDRCYLTLTGALHLKFGGAPAGPAGTGKTETTKDLAKAFAIQCVVFNCSDQLDFLSMGKFFKGLASSGAWACFDEFNRIDIEVLSVIAQQILTIQKAQQIGLERFIFEGADIILKASCAIFVTMNPGYAGRTELPDNLKALFRPVAMMVPNYALIAEISLFSYGFMNAKKLANKITTTFKLSSEQLSSQDHYDFGMRAVKTVIAFAGNLKREQQHLDESQICLRALRDVNVPKFTKSDSILFEGIVMDLFPGLVEIPHNHGILEQSIRKSIRQMRLIEIDEYIVKIIQLYETTTVRHGLMLVGPAGSGKTRSYEILKRACSSLNGELQPNGTPFRTVHTSVLNPKSITLGQLYGEFDLDTHEWTDGILSHLIRSGVAATDSDRRWYVFDGPVDALWIENMNTVLDDNKKLCLTSGEIIKLLPTQTMIFEVEDLKVASPATVSRCGMVYLETHLLGIKAAIDCWIKSISERMQDLASEISRLTHQLIYPAIELLRYNLREIVPTVDITMVMAFVNLMNIRFSPETKSRMGKSLSPQADSKHQLDRISQWTIFCLVWSFGASCDYGSREIFSDWVRKVQQGNALDPPFPSEGLVYDYRVQDIMETADGTPSQWVNWTEYIIPIHIVPDMNFADIEVPTIDNIRNAYLIESLLENNHNILCVGPSGSGKTMTISTKLAKNMPKKYICDFMMFSARTSANKTQDWIDSKLEKRRKNVYGPSLMKKQIFFVDDFNMPMLELYGAQPPLELIRQFMDFSGWYDRREVGSFRHIEDVTFVCAMGPPSGGANIISNRLLRHFHFLAFPEMTNEAKKTIFGTIIESWLKRTPSLLDVLDPLLMATLKVFSTVRRELLPTPDRSHYTFNLRDLARIFQGILMGQPEKIETRNEMLLLWCHENLRVIGDRLINSTDIGWFNNLLHTTLNEYFEGISMNEILGDGSLFYGDFCGNTNQYERIFDREKMAKILLDTLEDYNNSSTSPMKLVLFEEAMNHICRISRLLRQPRGNALLLGVGGSGRQSMTKIAAFLGDHICFQIPLKKAYNINDWHEDLKNVLLKAGVKNRTIVFLISDCQIQEDIWLEDLNNILNSGDVPNIYEPEELDTIFQAMRPTVITLGLQINRTNMFNVYTNKVRDNLHNVITMSPVGDIFRARIRQFPALINCCTIDWFHSWSPSALKSVAIQFIGEIHDKHIINNFHNEIVEICVFMHTSTIETSRIYLEVTSRHNYVTPASYLEMLSNYGKLLSKRKAVLASEITRFKTGLEKLFATQMEVREMQIQLARMKPELERATITTASVIKRIQIDTFEAQKTKESAQEQEREADMLKKQNERFRNEAESDLSLVRPMLLAAEASLKALNKSDITEVKALKRPPAGVRLVIEAMCIVKQVAPLKLPGKNPGDKVLDYWTPGSQMFADAGRFLTELENFDKTKITKEIIDELKPYIESPEFHPDKIIQVSKACHSLCLWLHAMYNYYFVNLKVQPKMAALQMAEVELRNTEMKLQLAINKLQEVEHGIHELENLLSVEENAKKKLEAEQQLCEDRILRAKRLIEGLADEQKRWQTNIAEIQNSYDNCVGDTLVSSGAIAYLTPFSDVYRMQLFNAWRTTLGDRVPHTPGCTPETILGDPVLTHKWHMDGLPRDSMSVQSAILVENSNRWPLFIDPQSQANKWIRKTEKQPGITIIKIVNKNLLRAMENCVRFGRACLIEDIGLEFDPALNNILAKNIFVHMGQTSIKIGDNVVPYNDQFRLYITTKLFNPHYTPEIAVKVLLVNFALTSDGLEDQLLSLVVMQERSDLEETRSALIISNAQMKKDLNEIEEKILERLNMSTGSTVDDIDLILTLEASKIKSNELKSKVIIAEKTKVDIDSIRLLYRPVANRGRVLYFCISDLQYIDYMYQYSLEWFINIFINSVNDADQNSDIGMRVRNINEYFTHSLFTNVCRSLFERNKLHFALLVCVRIRMENDLIDSGEWHHLISTTISLDEKTNPASDWLPTRCWEEIQTLKNLKNFKNFPECFTAHLHEFQSLYDSHTPETFQDQTYMNEQFDDMQKILVLKALRPDRIINAIQLYITKYLGRQFVQPQTVDLSDLFKESSPTIPLVFILSSGTDPASDLYKFAEKLRMGKKLYTISLGQGQGPRAKLMVEQSIELGNWVFFQNCHLAPSWMAQLEVIVNTFPDTIHRDFRLWLTSMPTTDFPVSILENSCKMTMEPPRGIRANMLRAYVNQVTETHDVFANGHGKHDHTKSLLMSLCMFHSVLLERRKFGALGFNIPYEFTNGDLAICISQLYMFIMEYDELPFEVLIYTAGHINYGGRITDDWDRRCLLTILQDYYRLEAISSDYIFDSGGLYHQPPIGSTFDDYIRHIDNLPLNDNPSIFGLHNNADISCSTREGCMCTEIMLALQPKVAGKAALNFEKKVLHLVEDMIPQIPHSFDVVKIQQKYPVTYQESLNTVLQQETFRYNELLRIMVSSLRRLSKALRGQFIMNEQLEVMAQSLFNNKIPETWYNQGYASLKTLGPWLIDLNKRIDFMRDWTDNGTPQDFWISGFFFPQALLTGTLQNFARHYALPIDSVDFSYQVQKFRLDRPPEDGCIVHGLFLEGCRWSGDTLEESHPKILYTEMKPIHLLPEENHECPATGIYICPVYKTLKRSGTLSTTGHSTNFVLSMEIPTKKSSTHWIKGGVALICALDY